MSGPSSDEGGDLVARADAIVAAVVQTGEVGLPFKAENVEILVALEAIAPDKWHNLRKVLKACKVKISDLETLMKRRSGERAAQADGLAGGAEVAVDETEAWDAPVNGAALLDDLTRLFEQYLVLPEHAAVTLATWCVGTHALDCFNIFARLVVESPTPECGKTTLLCLIEGLVPNPLLASNVTPASIFRIIDKQRPTLLIDEQQYLKDNPDLQIIIQSSHRRRSAFVIRNVGDNHEPRKFSTWAAVAVAAVGSLPEMIISRSLVIYMARKLAHERVSVLDDDHPDPKIMELKRKSIRWVADNEAVLKDLKIVLPPGLANRRADNWKPLLRIAALAGGPWPVRVEAAALAALTTVARELPELSLLLIADLYEIFAAEDRDKIDESETDRLSTAYLLDVLNNLLERPWKRYGRSPDGLSGAQLANLLRPFDIRSKQLWMGHGRVGGRNQNGYLRAEVAQAYHRYCLPPETDARPLDMAETVGFEPDFGPLDRPTSSGRKTEKNKQDQRSSGLAFSLGGRCREGIYGYTGGSGGHPLDHMHVPGATDAWTFGGETARPRTPREVLKRPPKPVGNGRRGPR